VRQVRLHRARRDEEPSGDVLVGQPSARMRAAASSIARGMPSSRRQISVTADALSELALKSGRTFLARSAKSSTASPSRDREGIRQVVSLATPIDSRLRLLITAFSRAVPAAGQFVPVCAARHGLR
jgi:hypothetical protein